MPQAESNRVSLDIVEEGSYDETPSTPTMAAVPYTSESLAYEKRTVRSNTVRPDRLTDDVIEVGAGSGGEINFEYKFGDYALLILAALGAADWSDATYTASGGDLDIAASSGGAQVLTGPAGTWDDYVVGSYVRISGASAGNNGVFKITAKTSTTLTIDNTAGVLQANADGAVVLQKSAKTGTTKKSFLIEKSFNDIGQYLHFRGMRVASWAMNIEAEQIITGSFGFMGSRAVLQQATIAGSKTAAGSLSVCSATANIGRIIEGGAALATKIKAARFNLNANPRSLTAVGNKYPIGINLGSFDITGTVEAYFEDETLYDKFVDHSDSSLVLEIDSAEDDRTIITIPNLKFTNAAPVGQGLNQDCMATLDFTAKAHAGTSAMLQVDLLT
jgi:hypothetical protein